MTAVTLCAIGVLVLVTCIAVERAYRWRQVAMRERRAHDASQPRALRPDVVDHRITIRRRRRDHETNVRFDQLCADTDVANDASTPKCLRDAAIARLMDDELRDRDR